MLVDKRLPDDVNQIAIVRKGRNTLATLAGNSKSFVTNMIEAFEGQVNQKSIERPTTLVHIFQLYSSCRQLRCVVCSSGHGLV